MLADGDRASFFQLRNILEGVVARGTAASLKGLTHYIGGKTGTTENENDGWFMSFTSDVTVAVWVGYDNSRGKQTLGTGQTGSRVAIPIAEPIIEASWQFVAPKTPLPPPSAEAARHLKALPIDYASGQRVACQPQRLYRIFQARRQQAAPRHPISRWPAGRAWRAARCRALRAPPRPSAQPAIRSRSEPQPAAPGNAGPPRTSDPVLRKLRGLFGL